MIEEQPVKEESGDDYDELDEVSFSYLSTDFIRDEVSSEDYKALKRGHHNKIMQSKLVNICKKKVSSLHFYVVQSVDFSCRPGLYI